MYNASKIKPLKPVSICHGVNIHIGRASNYMCQKSALLNYIAIRGINSGLLFHFQDKSPLIMNLFITKFCSIRTQDGIKSST